MKNIEVPKTYSLKARKESICLYQGYIYIYIHIKGVCERSTCLFFFGNCLIAVTIVTCICVYLKN